MINVVVVTSGKRPRLTLQTLNSLYKHTPNDRFNLTVYCDGCGTMDLRMRYKAANIVGDKVRLGVGGARNAGIEASVLEYRRGEMLYLSDDDVYFTDGWLEKMLNWFAYAQDAYVKVLGGQHHPYNQPNKTISLPYFQDSVIHLLNAVDGLSWLLDWPTWDRFGPFDANTKDSRSSEDVAFCLKVREAGFEVAALDPPVILNCGRTDSWGGTIPGADVAIPKLPAGVICE